MGILARIGFVEAHVFQIAQSLGSELAHALAARGMKYRKGAELGDVQTKDDIVHDSFVGKQRVLLRNVTAKPVGLRSPFGSFGPAARELFGPFRAEIPTG